MADRVDFRKCDLINDHSMPVRWPNLAKHAHGFGWACVKAMTRKAINESLSRPSFRNRLDAVIDLIIPVHHTARDGAMWLINSVIAALNAQLEESATLTIKISMRRCAGNGWRRRATIPLIRGASLLARCPFRKASKQPLAEGNMSSASSPRVCAVERGGRGKDAS